MARLLKNNSGNAVFEFLVTLPCLVIGLSGTLLTALLVWTYLWSQHLVYLYNICLSSYGDMDCRQEFYRSMHIALPFVASRRIGTNEKDTDVNIYVKLDSKRSLHWRQERFQ